MFCFQMEANWGLPRILLYEFSMENEVGIDKKNKDTC